ncbi:hypothetical protein HYV79_03185 [Candidatus Woesearchaeota archaeon]|nr:hypothetical protein [Candidatus Woesearchaeota archaeon]
MSGIPPVPQLFFGVGATFEVLSALAAFLIAFFGFKVYNFVNDRKYYWFSMAFAFITLSFVASAIVHMLIYLQLREVLVDLFSLIHYGVITGYVILLLTAYLLLLAVSTNLTNKRLLAFNFIILFILVFTSANILNTFFLILLIIIAFITLNYFEYFAEKTSLTTFFTFTSFFMLTISHALLYSKLVLASLSNLFYITGFAFQFIGYFIFLCSIIRILLIREKGFKTNVLTLENASIRKKKQT